MKHFILLSLAALSLSSCTTDGKLDKQKASAIADLALNYAVASGKVTPSDAALVREVGTIVLSEQPTAPEVPGALVTATK
jgi:hypothetical protein